MVLKALYEHVKSNGGFKWQNLGDVYELYATGVKTNIKVNCVKYTEENGDVGYIYDVVLFDYVKTFKALSSAKNYASQVLFLNPFFSEDIKNGKHLAEGKEWEKL